MVSKVFSVKVLQSPHYLWALCIIVKHWYISPSLPLLKQLHWIPVVYRITLKLGTQQPTYLCTLLSSKCIPILWIMQLVFFLLLYLVNLLHFTDFSWNLRSSVSIHLYVHKTNFNIGNTRSHCSCAKDLESTPYYNNIS